MSMSVEIPADLQPLLQQAIATGRYANEQELVTEVLRIAMPALAGYEQMRRDVQTSLEQIDNGQVRDADFDSVRQRLCDEYDESGNRT